MSLVLGTNCGFVTEAPTGDPDGSSPGTQDNMARALKVVAPAGATAITEMGWYCANATEAADFHVGIYDHDAINDEPENLLASSAETAKGTDAGWKTATVEYAITEGTTYWLAVQLDNTNTATQIDRNTDEGLRRAWDDVSGGSLKDPWDGDGVGNDGGLALYAVYTTGGGGSSVPVLIQQMRRRRA